MGGHEEKPALPSSEFALAVFLTRDHPSWHASFVPFIGCSDFLKCCMGPEGLL